jgi:UDP-N-acetylglucosamine 4-epimerase
LQQATRVTAYDNIRTKLQQERSRWLVTGAAGFIGSNLVELLVSLGQDVVGLDNFATGHQRNIDDVMQRTAKAPGSFRFIQGDIRNLEACQEACTGIRYVLHQAALGSVPRSIANPIATNDANVTGFLNMLVAARDAGVARFVYAASSSTYGDHTALPKVEDKIGRPLSPYAVTKYVNELYADVFQRTYALQSIGLRYFNVFGRRQDPNGAYAAVIPRWVGRLLSGETCEINGDGETSRDFCYIENVLQANLLAATAPEDATGEVYNVAFGGRTTLASLFRMIHAGIVRYKPSVAAAEPVYRPFRPGDVRHSQADVSKARNRLGYTPSHDVGAGLDEAISWYVEDFNRRAAAALPEATHQLST